jgi:hypothetical protein
MRAAGVTASDPYGYTQMAVDIATSGLPIHRFTDVPDVVSWGLSPWPLVPVGYDVPHALTGASTSVWPPGFSAFMAFAFRLGGESAMYLIPPVFGITALLASIWLCWEVLHSWPPARRLLVAGIAVYLVGTSFLQLELAVKPASDVAAQTFVVAAICLALASRRLRRYRLAVLAGLSLGVAFTMRYELVVIAVPLAFVFLQGAGGRHVSRTDRRAGADRGWQGVAPSRNWSVRALLCCAGAAWIPTLPIFAYHLVAYGHPFAVPSSELPLIAPANMLETAGPVAADFFSSNHFLYVVPFLVVGLAVLWRERRCHALLFLVWMTVIVLVHLPYLATDVRHLLPIFPAVSLIAAVGSIHLLQSVARLATKPSGSGRRDPGSGRWDPGSGRWDLAAMLTWSAVWVVTLTATLIALYARADLAFGSTDPSRSSFRAFGYLHANQRVAFDTLAAVTPPDAFVATTLNAGPIELYARRHPVRPSAWTAQEWTLFLDRAMTEHRKVFLLLDGDELKQPLERARSSHPVTYVTTLPAHYFAPDAGSIDADVDLFQIGP